jgi:hypothetical protein
MEREGELRSYCFLFAPAQIMMASATSPQKLKLPPPPPIIRLPLGKLGFLDPDTIMSHGDCTLYLVIPIVSATRAAVILGFADENAVNKRRDETFFIPFYPVPYMNLRKDCSHP